MNVPLIIRQQWFKNLPLIQQKMIRQSLELLEREKRLATTWSDYSFILFPMAKAYEGFIKEFFYRRGLISHQTYIGRKFRVGRSLNPDISQHHQDEWWLYDDLSKQCGVGVARKLWDAWIECRNHVFHYFPQQQAEYSLVEIEKKIHLLIDVMTYASECE